MSLLLPQSSLLGVRLDYDSLDFVKPHSVQTTMVEARLLAGTRVSRTACAQECRRARAGGLDRDPLDLVEVIWSLVRS